jgi:pyrimidine-nucleoside phosphorylase
MTAYEIITRKRDGNALSEQELHFFIDGYTKGSIPDYQMSALLMAVFLNGMTPEETHALTQIMLHSGMVVQLDDVPGIKVDKHSTGGVGDKVSLILAPIVAAAGVPVPMISGRGLGHTGGTLDKLESIPGFRVDYSIDEYRERLKKIGVCLIGQTSDLAPADKKIYALRDVTATVQSIPLISASIMSKKLAEGIDALVLDVKTGHGAFMREMEQSRELAKSLIRIGEAAGKPTLAYITNMDAPLGYAVGNWLEVVECIHCMKGELADSDLMEVTHQLSGAMIFLGGKAENIEDGVRISREMISSGKAWKKFIEIVQLQNGDVEQVENPDTYPASMHSKEVRSTESGWLHDIDSLEVGLSAIQLGAGRLKSEDAVDPKAGIILAKKPGDPVKSDDLLFTIYTDNSGVMDDVAARLQKAVRIAPAQPEKPEMILEFLDRSSV